MIPKKVFFTKGVGVHEDKLGSFELALRDAGIEKLNIVNVSSILPKNCKIISREDGLKLLKPGQITFCVMAKNETNEINQVISAAIGIAMPQDKAHYGYLSEYHSFENEKKAGDYAEDLASAMLATTLGRTNNAFKRIHICQSTMGDKYAWTTVIAAAVFVIH